MTVDSPGPGEHAPYFFLSYAHTPALDEAENTVPDKLVEIFYEDLRRYVAEVDDVPHRSLPAFIGREARSGDQSLGWSPQARLALSTCRVFVALCSPRYFESEWCGREWSAFAARSPGAQAAIVPVLWANVPLGDLPEAARGVQLTELLDVDSDIYSLMTLDKHRAQYQHVMQRIARRITTTARISVPTPETPVDPSEVANGFVPPPRPRLRVILLAERSRGGPGVRDWAPFGARPAERLADEAIRLASNLDFDPVLSSFDEAFGQLRRAGLPYSPAVLILDLLALADPDRREQLRAFDALDLPWVSLVIVQDPSDDTSERDRVELRALLNRTLIRRTTTGRIAARLAITRGVRSPGEFVRSFSAAVELAAVQYLRHSQTARSADEDAEVRDGGA